MARVFLFLAVAWSLGPVVVCAQSIEGVWSLVETETLSGPDAGSVTAQRGLLIFTDGHYSMAYETTAEPRPHLSASPTDAERGRVFGPYVSSAGTYELEGSMLTLHPLVNKNPVLVEQMPTEQVREIIELTDGTLRYTTRNQGVSMRTTTLTRVE